MPLAKLTAKDYAKELARMLGAIRAAKQCLKCHQVERGELLGAFSYVLERVKPVQRPAVPSYPAY